MKFPIKKTAISGAMKVLSAVASILFTILVTRMLGAELAGQFLLSFTILTIASTILRFGFDNVILKSISGYETSISTTAVSLGVILAFIGTCTFTFIFYYFSEFITSKFLSDSSFKGMFEKLILSLPALTLINIYGYAFQGRQNIVSAIFFQNLGVYMLFICTTFILLVSDVVNIDLATIYTVSAWLVLCLSIVLWYFKCGHKFYIKNEYVVNLVRSGREFWYTSVMLIAVQWSGVIIAGGVVSSSDLAYLSTAIRISGLLSFLLLIINVVFTAQYSKFWSNGMVKEMGDLSRSSSRLLSIVTIPMLISIIIFPKQIMSVFGSGFDDGAELLIVLAVGQFVNVITGSVGPLLNMTGHEKDYKNITIINGILTIALVFWLTQSFGVIGAAYGSSIGLILQNLSAVFMVKVRLKFWCLGF